MQAIRDSNRSLRDMWRAAAYSNVWALSRCGSKMVLAGRWNPIISLASLCGVTCPCSLHSLTTPDPPPARAPARAAVHRLERARLHRVLRAAMLRAAAVQLDRLQRSSKSMQELLQVRHVGILF